jgi:hypothetical protein
MKAKHNLDHDDFGLNPSEVMNVIDSRYLERDASRKPIPTFPHRALRTSLFCSALFLSMGAASADVDRCSTAKGAGRWGYTVTGENTSGSPDAIVGGGTVDAGGNVNLTLTEVTNGIVQTGTIKGLVKVNPDCAASLDVTVEEAPPSGTPLTRVKETWTLVYVDNQREIRGLLTSLVLLPNGISLPLPVQTLNAKMQFPEGFAQWRR